MIILKVYLSIIRFDESDKFFWKHEMILFTRQMKGRYVCYSMSVSKYNREKLQTFMITLLLFNWIRYIYLWGLLLIILEMNCVSFFETAYHRICNLEVFFLYLSCGMISVCISLDSSFVYSLRICTYLCSFLY